MKIGFVGQGYIGKNYANDFGKRGYSVVRYSLEPEYIANKGEIAECDVVFIAVPTPTTPKGFDDSTVREAVALVGEGKVAIIKSTILPGTTRSIQDENPGKVVLFSPEFLLEATAAYDVANPMFNIIGIPHHSAGHRKVAETIIKLYPRADHNFIVNAQAAELFKYVHNVHGYMRVIFSNLLYDLAAELNVDWADMKLMMDTNSMMSPFYNAPVHKGGRGAGGACFIKDMAAFIKLFEEKKGDDASYLEILKAMEKKNLELLALSNKDAELLRGVYGERVGGTLEGTVPTASAPKSQKSTKNAAAAVLQSRPELSEIIERYREKR